MRIRASFANAEGEHGILDLLTMTCSGRLAVLELKAGEHIHLPLQAATIGCAFVGSRRAERSLAMVIFKGSLCSRHRRSSIPLRPPCNSIRQRTDLLKYLSPELEVARGGPCRKLAPGTARGPTPVAPSGESSAAAERRRAFRNPAAERPFQNSDLWKIDLKRREAVRALP